MDFSIARYYMALLLTFLLLTACTGGPSDPVNTSTLNAANVVGTWKLVSVNSADVSSYQISLVVDASTNGSTYTFVAPVGYPGQSACAEYGTLSVTGNNLTTTPVAGSTCGSNASTATVSISGSTMTRVSAADGTQVYQKQTANSLTGNALVGTWKMMASDTAGTVTPTYNSNYALIINTSTYSVSTPSCSETGTWSVSGSTMSVSPGAGSTCNTSAYTRVASLNDPLLTLTGSQVEIWQKQSGASNSAPASTIAAGTSGGVNINWQLVGGATSYNVYRGTASGTLATKTLVGSVASGTYLDSTAVAGTMYYYQVTSVGANGESTPSVEVSGTATASASLIPSPVAGLTVIPGNTQANLSWNAVSGVTSYNIYSRHTVGPFPPAIIPTYSADISTTPHSYNYLLNLPGWSKIASVTLPSYTNTGLVNGDLYQYIVTAVNASGESLATSYVDTLPAAPAVVTWTSRASGTAANLYDVTEAQDAGSPLFLAVGGGLTPNVINTSDTGVMLSSSDGITWSPVAITAKTLTRVIYTYYYYIGNVAGGTFVYPQSIAIGVEGTIMTSPDNVTWTPRSSGTTNGLWGITFSNALTRYVAVGDGGTIITSSDGVAWTVRASGITQNLRRVQILGNKFVAVGWGGTILTSLDGINWSSQASGTTQAFLGAAYNGVSYVAVGGNGTILTSPDAVTWTAQTSGITSNILDILWDGNQWVAVGQAGTVLTSSDGKTWIIQTTGISNNLHSINTGYGLKYIVSGDGGTILTAQ